MWCHCETTLSALLRNTSALCIHPMRKLGIKTSERTKKCKPLMRMDLPHREALIILYAAQREKLQLQKNHSDVAKKTQTPETSIDQVQPNGCIEAGELESNLGGFKRTSSATERKQVHLYRFKPDQWRCTTNSPSRPVPSEQSRAGGEFFFLMPPSRRLAARSLRAQIKFKSKSQCEQTQRCQRMKASCQATKAKRVHRRRARCLFANSK